MEKHIQKFYAKWSSRGPALCRLLLGDDAGAERTCAEAFHGYLTRGLDVDLVRLPPMLLTFAIDVAKTQEVPATAATRETRTLADAVVFLPWQERAVFLLSNVMGLQDLLVGEIVEIPAQEVRRMGMSALFRLRELLPKDFFLRRGQ
jgi:DNA-directed RNA polymerase specialized sigma24 family protein